MSRQEALEAYIGLLMEERERYLYQHALNKVRVITRRMSAEEKAAYLDSSAFRTTLFQVQRRDRVYQGLRRKELVQAGDLADFEHLLPMIEEEIARGRALHLDFLRSVGRYRVSLEKAHQALDLLEREEPRRFFDREQERLLSLLEEKTELTLKKGNIASLMDGEDPEERISAHRRTINPHGYGREERRPSRGAPAASRTLVLPRLMDTVFRKGLPRSVLNMALHPDSLSSLLRGELLREYSVLSACGKIITPEGDAVTARVRAEVNQAERRLFPLLRRRFPEKRLRKLLAGNSSVNRMQRAADAAFEREQRLRDALLTAIPEHYRDLYPLARGMRRHFYLHLGPTNSGKTYEGVERLHGALRGIYLGPLRLLAAEQFEALNLDDVPCSLVTGEEQILVPGSRVQSSTVEMADLSVRYDVAVIDECQMIADRDRGGAWSAAILGLCAEEIHACASPDAEILLTRIIRECGDELTIVRHERMTKLEMEKDGFQFPTSVRPGDALIVFSKARVHAVAAELRSRGVKVSLIYGALPPDVRRNQAERFHQRETEVVVSTDAIAMGMNLPIERVVFLGSEKYDGDITRTLTDAEIKQIAGRAGRYGMYDTGYVNAFGFKAMIAQALNKPLLPLTEAVIRFPESLLGLPLPLSQIIDQWLSMQDKSCFSKASTTRMAALTGLMETKHTNKALLYRFICIPFDETDPDLLGRWKEMYHAECGKEHLDVLPEMPEIRDPEECTVQQLDQLEADYRRCDLYYNYVRLFLEEPEKTLDEIQRRKDLISQGIVHILSTQKLQTKTCRSCKRHLPWNWPYRLCESCYRRRL